MKRLNNLLLLPLLLAPDGAGGGGTSQKPPAAGKRPAPDGVRAPAETQPGPSAAAEGPAAGAVTVVLRHTTPYPRYRRAGLLLTGQWQSYRVTAEQRAALESDQWVEFQKAKEPTGFQEPDKT
ncbi:MAG: hypothetical protein LBC31_11665 [Treponema sp.]|jgi:hypothetical protein|nr:hypothetical protein [Treponema sp.]